MFILCHTQRQTPVLSPTTPTILPHSAPVNFVLHLPQRWLMPLCFGIQHWYLAPSNFNRLPDLSCQAVPCIGSYLSSVYTCQSSVFSVLVFLHEGVVATVSVPSFMFYPPGIEVPRGFSLIYLNVPHLISIYSILPHPS